MNQNYSENQIRAYKALEHVGEQIGQNNYRKQLSEHLKKGRKKSTFRFTVTSVHKEIVEAMPKVLRSEISPEEAILLIYQYETEQERWGE